MTVAEGEAPRDQHRFGGKGPDGGEGVYVCLSACSLHPALSRKVPIAFKKQKFGGGECVWARGRLSGTVVLRIPSDSLRYVGDIIRDSV